MKPKLLDVVLLKDDREGTIVEIFENLLVYLVETDEDMRLWPEGTPDEIVEITYACE